MYVVHHGTIYQLDGSVHLLEGERLFMIESNAYYNYCAEYTLIDDSLVGVPGVRVPGVP